MNLLRWIFGIPLAFAICVALLYLLSLYDPIDIGRHAVLFLLCHAVIVLMCFSSFVFLSSLFIPSNRKYAAIIAVLTGLAVAYLTVYVALSYKYSGDFTLRRLINYSTLWVGLLTGFYISYEVFKNRGWTTPKKPTAISGHIIDDSIENEEFY